MKWPFGGLAQGAYDFAMIDPPWDFKLWSNKGLNKSPMAHYGCMGLDEIMDLPVRSLLKPKGAIWLWSTWPLVARGDHAAVMRAWGLRPLTGGAWAKRTRTGKLRWGPGFVIRTVCEPFFIAAIDEDCHRIRGRGVANLIETIEAACVDGLARQHSRKPDEAYAIAERLTPDARRADVYAREPRPGWDGFGNELDKFKPGVDYRYNQSDRPPSRVGTAR